jgi:glycine/D-amino acid oxidase-like deaminating enzyme
MGELAERKDLHDGRSLWHDTDGRRVRTRQLEGDEAFEILIVGGGITGAIMALSLSAAGHEIAVVDRRPPGAGSTIASTAMIQFELDTPLIHLAKKLGRESAERAYRRSAQAVRDLKDLIRHHALRAFWADREALYLAGSRLGPRSMKDEVDARRAIGLDSRYLTAAEVRDTYGIDASAAILSSGSGEIDPASTAAECLRAAKRLGATVISPCEIVKLENTGRRVRLITAEGHMLSARRVILTTGYEVVPSLPKDAFKIVSSWAIATKPLPASAFWPGRCLIWEAADPYLYLRTTRDRRILAGGEDSGLTDPDRRAEAVPAKAHRLIGKVRRLLHKPELELDYAWGGAFAESPNSLPVFKPVDGVAGAFAVLGSGGNGITFAMLAASVVQSWLAGRSDRDAHLFRGA